MGGSIVMGVRLYRWMVYLLEHPTKMHDLVNETLQEI